MSKTRTSPASNFNQILQKFFLSAFVVVSFIAYAVHERLTNSNGGPNSATATPDAATADASASSSGAPAASSASNVPTPDPNSAQLPASSASSAGQGAYKDGTYTGPQVDVNYGLVQVQATIQHGRITGVQFLEYPNDRRTSVRINTIAMPYLQQEALQAQSANVDIISGATLTSEGFSMSLESALSSAH